MRALVGCSLAFVATFAARKAALACTSDNECKGDRVCSAGACIAPAAPQACTSDKECPGELVCTAQRCTAPSSSPAPTAEPALGAALPARPTGVQVSFTPAKDAAYQVAVETATGIHQCIAPCSLTAEPGSHRVQISGDASFTQLIDVPAQGGAFTVEQAGPSKKKIWWTMVVGGGVLTAVGLYGANQKNALLGAIGIAAGGPSLLAGVIGLLSGDRRSGHNAIRPRTAAASIGKRVLALDGWGVTPIHGGVAGGATFSF